MNILVDWNIKQYFLFVVALIFYNIIFVNNFNAFVFFPVIHKNGFDFVYEDTVKNHDHDHD
jgi:hypothetical protein